MGTTNGATFLCRSLSAVIRGTPNATLRPDRLRYNDGYYSGGEYVEWCDGDCGDSSGWTDDSQEPETSDPSNDESTDSEPTDPGDDDSDYTDPDDADDDDEG